MMDPAPNKSNRSTKRKLKIKLFKKIWAIKYMVAKDLILLAISKVTIFLSEFCNILSTLHKAEESTIDETS